MDAVNIRLYEFDEGEPIDSARLVGVFARGQIGKIPFTPSTDRNKFLIPISIAGDGTPDYQSRATRLNFNAKHSCRL